jgi:hypothetical protein
MKELLKMPPDTKVRIQENISKTYCHKCICDGKGKSYSCIVYGQLILL